MTVADPNAIGDAVWTAIQGMSADDKKDPQKIYRTMFAAMWNYLKSNVVVPVPATGIVAPNGPCTGGGQGTLT